MSWYVSVFDTCVFISVSEAPKEAPVRKYLPSSVYLEEKTDEQKKEEVRLSWNSIYLCFYCTIGVQDHREVLSMSTSSWCTRGSRWIKVAVFFWYVLTLKYVYVWPSCSVPWWLSWGTWTTRCHRSPSRGSTRTSGWVTVIETAVTMSLDSKHFKCNLQ